MIIFCSNREGGSGGLDNMMDMHRKGNDKMGRSLDWNSGAGWVAVGAEAKVGRESR